jgi:hypothetical protein
MTATIPTAPSTPTGTGVAPSADPQALGARLLWAGLGDAPQATGPRAFAGALREGADIATALPALGVPARVVSAVRLVDAPDVQHFLEAVAAVLQAGRQRDEMRRAAAWYPMLLAATLVAVALVVWGVANPALVAVARLSTHAGAPHGLPLLLAPVAVGLGVLLLVLLAVGVRGWVRLPLFAAGLLDDDRARLLATATAALAAGATLPCALQASAVLVGGTLVAPTTRLAAGLERGEVDGAAARAVLGAAQAHSFAAGVTAGAAGPLLSAFAAHHTDFATTRAAAAALAAQLGAVIAGGVVLLAVALAFYLPYLHAIIGSAP